jgi:RES domain-containing protein
MYDTSLYQIDPERVVCDATLRAGAILYRAASLSHWERVHIVTGVGAEQGRHKGRFHEVAQRASYCANNVVVCIAEKLYHQYRLMLDGIYARQPADHLALYRRLQCMLVVFEVDRIDGLVCVDADAASRDYDARLSGSTIVFPDPLYEPLRLFSSALREKGKRGVVYPSARHSEGLAFALFRDETERVRATPYLGILMELSLVSEEQNFTLAPAPFSVFREKLHATMGHFRFIDVTAFEAAKRQGLFHPKELPVTGYVDFVRRRYRSYPLDAVLGG